MKGRRRNGFFKTVDDSKFTVTSVHDLSFFEDRSLPSREKETSKEKKGASNNFALTQVEKQAENKRKNKQKNAQLPN